MPNHRTPRRVFGGAAALLLAGLGATAPPLLHADESRPKAAPPEPVPPAEPRSSSTLEDRPIPLDTEGVNIRPPPFLEYLPAELRGDAFLGTGPIFGGFELPTGAVWQPQLLVFGTLRTAYQDQDSGRSGDPKRRTSEISGRLDAFANLRLSGTERVLAGWRPLDHEGEFTSWIFRPTDDRGWQERLGGEARILFFEGDFGQIFPKLDPHDSYSLDFGFAVGRQPLRFQDGILINDFVDAIGVARNTLLPPPLTNLRVTPVFGWHEVNRGDHSRDRKALLAGVFFSLDTAPSTIDLDLAYVDSYRTGNALYLGGSGIQRVWKLNTTVRALASIPTDHEDERNSRGTLLYGEVSWTPPAREDLVYLSGFWAIDAFSSAARDPSTGGPLSRTGILFEAVGLGRYASALPSDARRSVGGALGYQLFFNHERGQLVLEVGGRRRTDEDARGVGAVGARFQHALGQHFIVIVDGFVGKDERVESVERGGRFEVLFKF